MILSLKMSRPMVTSKEILAVLDLLASDDLSDRYPESSFFMKQVRDTVKSNLHRNDLSLMDIVHLSLTGAIVFIIKSVVPDIKADSNENLTKDEDILLS